MELYKIQDAQIRKNMILIFLRLTNFHNTIFFTFIFFLEETYLDSSLGQKIFIVGTLHDFGTYLSGFGFLGQFYKLIPGNNAIINFDTQVSLGSFKKQTQLI